jgi:hypothetical protein
MVAIRVMQLLLSFIVLVVPAFSQTASLRGQITDESGAIIPGATVMLNGPDGAVKTATSGNDGRYVFASLPNGEYSVRATAPQLTLPQAARISLKDVAQILNLQLKVAATPQQVSVQENPGALVSTDAAANVGALVLRGDDLDALADDPDDLAADLQALAGPSAGPSGAEFFIDGFSGGQLPSKESIREIRINQNPFSAEYDKLGFGRIEVFTKPGTDKFKGTGFYNFGDTVWNSRDPYAARKAPFILKEYGGNLSGPVTKKASFFLNIERHAIDNGAIIHATTLDPKTLRIIDPFTDVLRISQRRVIVSPRVDYQLNANNTLSLRYQWLQADIPDSGIGSFNLASRGQHSHTTNQTVQVTETAVLGSSTVNETRFQYIRTASSQISNDSGPAILVLGAFSGGGAQTGNTSDLQDNYEFQNYTTIAAGKHTWKFGARLRGTLETNVAPQNFGGTFTFAGGLVPELDTNNQPILDSSGNLVEVQITSIQRYQRTLLFQNLGLAPSQAARLGGIPTQFTLSAGTPGISLGQFDAGFFARDDWRLRSNLTLSLGFRYEIQTNISDRGDIAPRLGLAWAPRSSQAKPGKTVIRAGFGMFYDRFSLTNVLTAERFDGIHQQQFVVTNPLFYPNIPSVSALSAGSTQTIRELSSSLRAPWIIQSALGIERQLPADTSIALTYANSHGLHQLWSNDINAPLPGTFNPQIPASGVLPFPGRGPIFLMQSSGLYNQNQFIVTVNSKISRDISLFGNYTYNRAFSNTDGIATYPANPYDFSGEYGPAATDITHRVNVGGTISTKWDMRFSPLFTASTGIPFDITTGSDLYGDTLFTARPGIAANPAKPGLIATAYGPLDPNPSLGEQLLPRNSGRGPGSILFNARISKIFTFGPKGEGSISAGGVNRGTGGVFSGQASTNVATKRRYNLAISAQIRNLLNHTNPGPITGNITSPLFGRANQSAGANALGGTNFLESANNRRLELQARFSF